MEQQQQQPTFLGLPREVRDRVYHLLYVQPQDIDCYRVGSTTPRRLRRQLAREGADPDCCGRRTYGCGAHHEARLLEHVLRTIGDAVPENAEVTVDDNRSLFLCDAVDRCFSGRKKGFRRARLPEGDAHYNKKGRFDPDDVGGVPLDCDGQPVPEEVLKRLPGRPTEALPSALFGEEDEDDSRR